MKEFAKTFYKSKAWKQCREAYIAKRIQIDGGLCEVCHDVPGYIVHHKINLTPDNIIQPEVTLNHDNLSYECHKCHDKHEGHGLGRHGLDLLVDFDETGQPIPKKQTPP